MNQYWFLSDQDVSHLRTWWRWLNDNRGDRAQLRRAETPDDILLTPAFAHFLKKMPQCWNEGKEFSITDAAMVAAVVARIKADNKSTSFARSLASPKQGGKKAVMSELRFQQLQKSRTPEDFFRRLCRAVALLGGKANLASVANDILHWLKEYRTAPARKPEQRLAVRWATDYYAASK